VIWVILTSVAAGAYLLGSIPSGYLIGRLKGVDLRTAGSGNIGATNTVRVLGRKWGSVVFAMDMLKGSLAILLALTLSQNTPRPVVFGVLAAACAMLGHVFPVWLGFKGGKGIATSAGIMITLFPPVVFLAGLIVWLALFFSTRYVSVASIGASITLPAASGVLVLLGKCDPILFVVAFLMCLLALARHRSNIERLMAGTEKRFEKKSSD